MKCSRHIWNFL